MGLKPNNNNFIKAHIMLTFHQGYIFQRWWYAYEFIIKYVDMFFLPLNKHIQPFKLI